MSQIPQSKWARGSKLLKLASDVALKEVSARLPGKAFEATQRLTLRIEQTKLLVETLSQMKGAAMKAGQLMGLEGADYFPPEVSQVLSKLQSHGSTLPAVEIEAILKAELPQETLARLSDFGLVPLASASIGQVHKANWENSPVALKIQFPAVANTIDSDVALLKTLVEKFYLLTGKDAELDELFEEIRLILHQETDYHSEFEFMKLYRQNFSSRPEYRIPNPIRELSTKNILAMEFIEGKLLKDWITEASSEAKQEMAERMMQLFILEYLQFGLVQTDPNWGNFMVDTNGRLVLLDFGATKSYSEDFRDSYRQILSHTMLRKKADLITISEQFGLLNPKESQDTKDAFLHMMDEVIAPFRHHGHFDFANETYSKASREATMKFARSLKYSPPPRELIFLHRKLGGIFQTLKRLEAKLDLTVIWKQMMQK